MTTAKQKVPAPTLRYAIGSTVVPGDRLGTIRQASAGLGTYVRGGSLYASRVGRLQVVAAAGAGAQDGPAYQATVQSPQELASAQVLSVGQVVLAKVTRIATQQAFLDIVACCPQQQQQQQQQIPTTNDNGSFVLRYSHQGTIRREDVRTGASEQVQIQEAFLPGDLVLCRILSLGDSRRYFLTTAAPELGVIHAVSAVSGKPMAPCSWKEMQCPETGKKEPRKCARPRAVPVVVEESEAPTKS